MFKQMNTLKEGGKSLRPKMSKRRAKRVRNLVVICALTAVILSVSTYAWFIGMKTVNVSKFDVEIASTDGLLLSLNGTDWDTTLSINNETYSTASYATNTNNWPVRGLFPISSIGGMDTAASRMMLYEKASLTSTPGGYRLMASRVKNYEIASEPLPEQDGYVVFDLMIRNFSGTQYIEDLNVLDEEAIYLTVDSEVTVSETGVADTGIENSVRVAFAQIGRVAGTTVDEAVITGITCTSGAGVTGICRTQIWEPNDRDHVDDAISWYDTSCLSRTGTDVTSTSTYGTACGEVIDGVAYPTYAVSTDIGSDDNVDIYDGAAYNGYTGSSPLLSSYNYFTDTEKLLTGTSRPTFMTLAPNSITKVRVYIYIEGQDIDNYDFASIGKSISVKFGFTKERYTEDDIDYNGPDLNQGSGPSATDMTPPVLTLLGDNPLSITLNEAFTDPGAEAEDNIDGDLTTSIVSTGTVNTAVAGTYTRVYKVTDAAGNTGTKTRQVIVTE